MKKIISSLMVLVTLSSLGTLASAQERPRLLTRPKSPIVLPKTPVEIPQVPGRLADREPKQPADTDGINSEVKQVNWSYLRLNRPGSIQSFLLQAQAGQIPTNKLYGLAQPHQVEAMVRNVKPNPILTPSISKDKLHEKVEVLPAPIKPVFVPGIFPTPVKEQKTDVGKKDLGQFPIGEQPTYVFEETALQDGTLKLLCISKDWQILSAATETGEIDANGKPKLDQNITNPPKGPVMLPVKAGQTFKIVLKVTKEGANGGVGDSLAAWIAEGAGVSFSGAIVAHYYENSIAVTGASGLQLVQGKANFANATVRNDTPFKKTVSVSAIEMPNGVSVEGQTVTLAAHESRKLNFNVNVAANAPEAFNQSIHLRAISTDGLQSDGYLYANIYLPFYTWHNSGSAGKVDVASDVTVGANGLWHWNGNLHDNSTWYGDDYVFLFYFNKPLQGKSHLGAQLSGTLGAKYSGPAVDRQFDLSGINTDIAQNYGAYVGSGYHWKLSVAGDITQILKPIGEWLVQNGVQIVTLIAA
jgi:hypothetical protein